MPQIPTSDSLPTDLLAHDQWVCWQTEDRDGKQTKVPINPSTGRYASTTDRSTWTSFEQARDHATASAEIAGVGFVFTDADPFVGIDLDDCRDEDGTASDWAAAIIDELDSYTELSPSGTGYHVIVTGALPAGANRKGGVECYETARYFTVTGDSIHDPPRAIAKRTSELEAVHAEYLTPEQTEPDAATERPQQPTSTTGLDDEEVLEKATSAANGPKFERLWNGSTTGYESHSEADMALCFQLAFWTGGDAVQMDRLFRRSGLMREKWDEVHFADGSTYGEKTIERAVARVTEFYNPPESEKQSPTGENHDTEPPLVESVEQRSAPQPASSDPREQHLLGLIDRLEARVKALEAENQKLREDLRRERERHADQQQASERTSTEQGESASLWERLTSRL